MYRLREYITELNGFSKGVIIGCILIMGCMITLYEKPIPVDTFIEVTYENGDQEVIQVIDFDKQHRGVRLSLHKGCIRNYQLHRPRNIACSVRRFKYVSKPWK